MLILSLDNIKNMAKNEFTLDKLAKILTPISPLYPLWIEVTYKSEEQGLIEVRFSLRFRKPSELKHKETW